MIKKIGIIIICFTMLFTMYVNHVDVNAQTSNPEVRVKFLFSYDVTSKQVSSSEGLIFGYESNGEFVEIKRMSSNQRYTVKADPDTSYGINVFDQNGNFVFFFDSRKGNFQVKPLNSPLIRLRDYYRGFFEFRRFSIEDMTVINVVKMEDYLRGVVPREIEAYLPSYIYERYNSNSEKYLEALKAQAIAARTYAYICLNNPKYANYDAHLSDEPDCQIYRGYGYYNNGNTLMVEQESTNQAIEDTHGEVLKYNGRFAYAYYSASNGGYTEDAANVWINSVSYLPSKPDPYEVDTSSRYYWQRTYTKEGLRQYVSSKGEDIGEIQNVEITKKAISGRPIEVTISGSNSDLVLTKSECRNYFGFYGQYFTVINDTKYKDVNLLNGNLQKYRKETSEIKVLGANGVMSTIKNDTIINGAETFSGIPQIDDNPQTYTFVGRGWGHAIGMSQEGAKGMALKGFSYKDILSFYYTGTYIEDIY